MAFVVTPKEIFDMIVMTAAAGFIFMDMFRRPEDDDPVTAWQRRSSFRERFLYAAMLVAPPILLHELAHKLVATSYGLTATFHAAYGWLTAGILLKLVNFPFLIIVPAYVRIFGQATPLESALIAFSGPAVHLVLFLVSLVMVRRKLSPQALRFWQYSKYINGFLFVFNMIPIPGFDGSKVFAGLIAHFA